VRAAVRAIELARLGGARISVDLSSWSAIRERGAERFRGLVESLEPDVVFANEDEDESSAGLSGSDLDPEARRARMLLRRRRARRRWPWRRSSTRPARATRSRRAGSSAGPDLALEAAARCVQRSGSMPGPATDD
jgi:hypothetical protein